MNVLEHYIIEVYGIKEIKFEPEGLNDICIPRLEQYGWNEKTM